MRPIAFCGLLALFASCQTPSSQADSAAATGSADVPIIGTWRLISGTTITKGDSAVTDYTKNQHMIKIVNGTHFAFMRHDTNVPADSTNHFDAGGGSYTLKGNAYTEHLDYYSDKRWEGKPFSFTVSISNDTLTQKGQEKVEGTGIDREIIEKYVKEK